VKVWVLNWHLDVDCTETIGVYSSQEKAEEAREQHRIVVAARNSVLYSFADEDFDIFEHDLDGKPEYRWWK
jgi:hypothetical protein